MRTAIVYDRVNKWGGAERVLLALHEIFPDAPLFTSVYQPDKAPWAQVFPEVHTSFLNRFPPARSRHEILAPFMPKAFESLEFDDYDLVISVTSEAAKGIITGPHTLHVCYCLTPTRYLWSGYNTYFKGTTFKGVTKPLVGYLRKWDRMAAKRPDIMVAISTNVQKRIKKYYHRESQIIYPPLDDKFFKPNTSILYSNKVKRGKYFLIVSRLVPYKRVDLAVEAFNNLRLPLYIIGTGSEEKRLKARAGKNIKFLGQLTDGRLFHYYEKAKGLVMPQEEDFGLVALEAQSFGVPVIAYGAGGAFDTVVEGKTGLLFKKQSVKSLIGAVSRFGKVKFDKKRISRNVAKFSKRRFKKELMELITANLK